MCSKKHNMRITSIILLSFISLSLFSQKGKNGVFTVSTANVKINEFTDLTSNANTGNTIINVTASSLNANGRFSAALAPGDLIMIIQMQGAFSKTAFTPSYAKDSTYGYIYDYANCGNHEFAEVKTVISATQIEIDCGLANNYTSSGKVQIVRVPRYNSLTIASTGTLTTDGWNGTIGGILIAEVNGNTIVNTGGVITATGLGFRGGAALGNGGTGDSSWGTQNVSYGAEKGEGIASNRLSNLVAFNDSLGKQCKGAPANGGGGGNANNCGGGGGANAGNLSTYNGYGIPNASFNAIWNLEWPGRASVTSSGGGKGGYGTSSTSTTNINTVGPNSSLWGGFARRNYGGCGGHPLNYSTGKIYLGGGGGAGHMTAGQSNGAGACSGGNGGGLVFILNYGTVSGTGSVTANGAFGGNAFGTTVFGIQGIDGAGGAGAGGTIIIESAGAVSGIVANAIGGRGGNQVISGTGTQEGQGPGGGGGGGYIASNGGVFTQSVAGGLNGTSNAIAFNSAFPMNGATSGDVGIGNQTILATLSNIHILTASINQTICANQSATVSASTTNSLATISWFNAIAGGNAVASGSVYSTPVFATAGTYTVFAGSCPGLYRTPVVITVVASPTLAVTNATICAGQTATLTASGASSYTWTLGSVTGTTFTNSPVSSTTVGVTGSVGTCTSSATASITLNSIALITVNTATICAGQTTTLTASGVGTYTWNTGSQTNTLSVSPATTTVYTISGTTAGCNGINTTTVTVNSLPVLTVNSATICSGQNVLLTASGANTYTWSNTIFTNTQTVNPTSTQSYSVIGTSALGCVASASVVANVSVTSTPTLVANSATICAGQTATLTASGAATYTWNPGNISGTSYTIAPTTNTFVTILAANGTCTAQLSPSVTIGANITIPVNSATICAGQTTTLIASGATSYTWNTGPQTNTLSVSPASTTVYTINGANAGCGGTNTATVTVNAVPTLTTNTAIICAGQTATLIASGASTYTWSNGPTASTQTVNPNTTTTYTVSGTNIFGCKNTILSSITVTVTPTPTVSVNSTSICVGNTATLSALGATNYTWSTTSTNPSISVSPAATATYSVIGSSGACSSNATATVVVDNVLLLSFTQTLSICPSQTVELSAFGSNSITTTYTWSNGSSTYSQIVSPSNTTIYTVNGNSPSGCPAVSGSFTINVNSIVADFSGITSNIATVGDVLNLTNTSTNATSINWTLCNTATSSSNTVTYPLNDIGNCCITLVAANSTCTNSATKCIDVVNQAVVSIPNVFTPNGDGRNELFKVTSIGLKSLNCSIYDRWGLKLYEWDGLNGYWDGNAKSGSAPDGTYFYLINYTDLKDVSTSEKGFLNLFRN